MHQLIECYSIYHKYDDFPFDCLIKGKSFYFNYLFLVVIHDLFIFSIMKYMTLIDQISSLLMINIFTWMVYK